MNFLAIITPLIMLAIAAYLGGWVLPGRHERHSGENTATAEKRASERPPGPNTKKRRSMSEEIEEEQLVASNR
jgi:hypothetical protein